MREFNLDIAKTLLLFSAAMYERDEEQVNSAIIDAHANKPKSDAPSGQFIAGLTFFFIVQIGGLSVVMSLAFLRLTGLIKYLNKLQDNYGGYSLVNMSDPGMFERHDETVEKAKRAFSQAYPNPGEVEGEEDANAEGGEGV